MVQNSSKTRTWANDDNMANPSEQPAQAINEPTQDNSVTEQLPSLPKKARTQESPAAASHDQPQPMVVDHSGEDGGKEEPAQEDTEAVEEAGPASDADWLRSKTSRLLGLLDEDEQAEFDQHKPEEAAQSSTHHNDESRNAVIENIGTEHPTNDDDAARTTPEHDQNVDLIRASARLFLRNLAYDIREEDLQPLFAPFGKIEEVSAFVSLLSLEERRWRALHVAASARMMNFLIGTSDAKQMMSPGQEILVDASCLSEEQLRNPFYTMTCHIYVEQVLIRRRSMWLLILVQRPAKVSPTSSMLMPMQLWRPTKISMGSTFRVDCSTSCQLLRRRHTRSTNMSCQSCL